MIHIQDNFLSEEVYNETYSKLLSKEFSELKLGDDSFWVQESDPDFDKMVLEKISAIESVERKSLLSFFRVATDTCDTDWRIHADSKIGEIRPERALVLYISPSTMEGIHGTAFWKHKKLGYRIPDDISNEEFDRMLTEEANALENWDISSIVGYVPNRLVTYPSVYFHSKFPNIGWEGGRMVYVMFYI